MRAALGSRRRAPLEKLFSEKEGRSNSRADHDVIGEDAGKSPESAPDANRTRDTRLRRAVLYPLSYRRLTREAYPAHKTPAPYQREWTCSRIVL